MALWVGGGTWAVLGQPVPNKNRYSSVTIRYWWAQMGPSEGGSTWVFYSIAVAVP